MTKKKQNKIKNEHKKILKNSHTIKIILNGII